MTHDMQFHKNALGFVWDTQSRMDRRIVQADAEYRQQTALSSKKLCTHSVRAHGFRGVKPLNVDMVVFNGALGHTHQRVFTQLSFLKQE